MDPAKLVLCVLIFAALGVHAGWNARLGLLIPLAASAAGASMWLKLDLAMAATLALILNAAAQSGYVLGTVTVSRRLPSRSMRRPQKSHR